MPVSRALEGSARAFNLKYTCNFSFAAFEEKVEEFTFLRPNGGWIDVYKTVFARMYKKTLEKVDTGRIATLDGEAMLDDFEYTLIRPYVKESDSGIKHKPYVGMDRLSRLEYLERLTNEAPSNTVELYADKYKNKEISLVQLRRKAENSLSADEVGYEQYVEIAGAVKALENVSGGRSVIWRVLHPFKSAAEKKAAAIMKRMLVGREECGEKLYSEALDTAYETFDGRQRVSARLSESTANAKEELNRKQKMNDAIRESLRADGTEGEPSSRVGQYALSVRENKGLI